MQARNRMRLAALVSPLLLLGVMVQPAQAATKTFSCSAGGFTGYIYLSDTRTPVVSYKILKGSNTGGNSADIYVSDGGVAPSRLYQVTSGIQDGAWHAMQGPYNRGLGGFAFTFVFDKSNWPDPSCSGGGSI